ncbi:MAG: ATP-dependent helicase [Candidatus Aminicenantes bacterium]|nr:ATP-dependent helicase [Candidatus Aminicenantes bacterium]
MKKYTLKKSFAAEIGKYTIDYKAELNQQQFKAVTNIHGPQLVIAGAGSGKTRTLIFRVAFLVENNINPGSILLLTFTRKSAQEMMRRASFILDERCSKVAGGTFHSFANYMLRKYAPMVQYHPNFSIVDRGDAEDIINSIRAELALNKKERRFPRKTTIMNIISKSTNKCIPVEDVLIDDYPHFEEELDDVLKISNLYRKYKRQKQVMDYDDLLVNLGNLLKENEQVREKISDTYRYIMVDEYQDTNKLQAEIAALLACKHSNIMVVGDDSQSIYSFRGANFRNIMDFPSMFPDTTITTLEQNYRSTRPILELTNAIIENAREKYSKKLFSDIAGQEKPAYLKTIDETEQAEFIGQRVLELREEGVPLNKIAVLFRASWHANELEVELKNRNIPYVKYGGLKFAEAAHIKDVLSFMRVLNNPFDDIAWLRSLTLLEGIGPSYANKIVAEILKKSEDFSGLIAPQFAKKKFFADLQKLYKLLSSLKDPTLKPADQLEKVIIYYTPMFELLYDDYRRRTGDLDSLLRIAQRYKTLEEMLTDVVLEPPDMSQVGVESTNKDDEKLVLSTIHSAKGLEWHSVFIIHLVEGYFPSARSAEREENMEEERRLFYVAATRAQRNLYLVTPEIEPRSWGYHDDFSGYMFAEPCRFLTEIENFNELTEPWALEIEKEDPF